MKNEINIADYTKEEGVRSLIRLKECLVKFHEDEAHNLEKIQKRRIFIWNMRIENRFNELKQASSGASLIS